MDITREKIEYWLIKDRIPFTKLLILSNIATYLAVGLFRAGILMDCLTFMTSRPVQMPWTYISYPWLGVGDIIGFLFGIYWLWIAGGSLERSWGTRTYTTYFLAMSAISAAGLMAGDILSLPNHQFLTAAGLWFPLAAVTVAFAMLNPEQQILFFMVVPMKLKYLALLDVAILLVSYSHYGIVVALFSLAGCAFSYWYVLPDRWFGLGSTRNSRARVMRVYKRRSFFARLNPLRHIRGYRENKRVEKLFRDSGLEEDGDD